ncbi:caprin-1-like isoform X2 [Nerophis lumbriciformis]|uniref:caprin-1-like isoform X2 n=1 Tax=Nerophis lumbriciformis TaxID=546530 RepID=UPI002ADF6DE0|nr:caprin-1-like isoform X2 [Nerophis lumbriciformis]
MPSAMVGNNAVQSAIPELGKASQSETMKQVLGVIDKKVRNMEKKKSKLDDYQAKKDKGERLNQDQLEALSKYQEILNNIDFARELQKGFLTLGQDIQKTVKKTARREQLHREELEQLRLKTVLELQFLLDQLGDETVRQELKQPDASGSSLLTDADLASFDEFYKLVGPDRNYDVRLTEQYKEASLHLWELLEGKNKAVAGTSYKSLKGTLDKLLQSGFFDRAQSGHNGTCEVEVEVEAQDQDQEKQTTVTDSNMEEQTSEPATVTENHPETVKVETTEFVNRQFIPESTYSSTDTEVEEWSVDVQMVNSLQLQPPTQLTPEPTVDVNPVTPSPPTDPVVRKQVVQDLMAQMQGMYNFMQDSMLEFDGQALDPAIVSAQPMKPVQTVDLQQMASLSESRLSQISAATGPKELSQAAISLSSEPSSASSCSLSSAFPPASKSVRPGGINVNAAPFQSVQAVFNMNTSTPPSTGHADPLKQPGQFSAGYAQGFSGQSDNTVDQPEAPQETLQSVVAGFQPQAQVLPSPVGHEDSSPGASFGQSGQSFYNSRPVTRGGARNSRGAMNGYRGSSNGFRGRYEGYRPSFSNPPSGGYTQSQFNTGTRDYSNNYQREGYQQGYKRGSAQGARGLSRGNAQAMRS